MTTRRRGIVGFPGGCDLQGKGLTRSGGDAGCDGVPTKAAMNLVEVTANVSFSGKRFEAHGAGFSSRCAERPWPTSSNNKNNFYLKCLRQKGKISMMFFPKQNKNGDNVISLFQHVR